MSGPPEKHRAADALKIVDLLAEPRFTGQLAGWLHDQWYRHRSEEFAQVQDRLLSGNADRRFPATFVACLQDQAVGTFTLESAVDPLTELPLFCLSNVYVPPAWRGQGIGRQLCEAAVERTRYLRIPRLSLFTASHADYYEAIGWQYVNIVPLTSRGQNDLAIQMRRDVMPSRRNCGTARRRLAQAGECESISRSSS